MRAITYITSFILAFMLLVITPLTNVTVSNTEAERREVLDIMDDFLDTVTDTGTITKEDLTNLNLDLSSFNAILTVKVKRMMLVVNPKPGSTTGEVYKTFVESDNIDKLNKGDKVKITVKAISYSGLERITMLWSKILMPKFEYTLARSVR